MDLNEFLLNLGCACAIVIFMQLTGSDSQADEYGEEEEHREWNMLLTAKKSAPSVRKLQCVSSAHPRRPLKSDFSESRSLLMDSMYDEEIKSESHTEICYRNDHGHQFDPNPPTLDPNYLPPTAPEMEIKSNSSILVSWQAIKRKKYPIEYFMVEFYQYDGPTFSGKCCTWVKNEIKNKTSDSYHEELIDALEPNFDYKFRVASSYPPHNQSWGPWGETIHLPADFEGDDAFDQSPVF